VIAAAWIAFRDRFPGRRAAAALAVIVIVYNSAYVWTRKHAQFEERAAPSVAVVRAAREASGPVYVQGFPYTFQAAELAVLIETGRPADTVRLWTGGPNPPGPLLRLDPGSSGP
jgi:hypothetical protein